MSSQVDRFVIFANFDEDPLQNASSCYFHLKGVEILHVLWVQDIDSVQVARTMMVQLVSSAIPSPIMMSDGVLRL